MTPHQELLKRISEISKSTFNTIEKSLKLINDNIVKKNKKKKKKIKKEPALYV